MKTKIVYVLTCASEDYYIEQALMAVFSCRHWNPDAHISLIVDDLTDSLLTDGRTGILHYISEKIVVPFEDRSYSMMFRSRFIKTSVRDIISGDFIFIDCDTITQKALSAVDSFQCEVGAVYESHLRVEDFCESLFSLHNKRTLSLGFDLAGEEYYFSSGVLYVKDTLKSKQLYRGWFNYWKESTNLGISADQPALAKANREIGYVIEQIPNAYNCIVFTQPPFTSEAFILHFSSYHNPSFLFTQRVLHFIKENGLCNDWLKKSILNPCSSFLPFDYQVFHSTHSQRKRWCKDISVFLRGYGTNIDSSFTDFPMHSRFRKIVVKLFQRGYVGLGVSIWMYWKYLHLHLKRIPIPDNICRK